MPELIALAVIFAIAYGFAAFGQLRSDKPVVVPSPVRSRRRTRRR